MDQTVAPQRELTDAEIVGTPQRELTDAEVFAAPAATAPGAPSVPISSDNSGAPPPVAPPPDPMRVWADEQEKKSRDIGSIIPGMRGLNDVMRATVQGTAVGNWGDQINAYLASSGVPGFGAGPGPAGNYEQELALQQARNRASDAAHPIRNTVAGLLGGTGAAWLTGGAGGPATQTVLDTLSATSNAASKAPYGERGSAGAAGGGATLPLSAILNAVSSKFAKYTQLTPEVVAAAKQLGIELPFFAKAENQGVQAAGRQYAQTHLESPLNKAWQEGSESVGETAGRAAAQGTGSPDVRIAPYDAGSQIHPGLQASIDAAQVEKGRLTDDIRNLLPPGPQRYDVPGARAATNAAVSERVGLGSTTPRAGLADQLNFTGRPPPTADTMGPWGQRGGSTWEEISNHATDIGQRLGQPAAVPRAVDDARLSNIYAGVRDDQRAIVRNTSGPRAEEAFNSNVERQRVLSEQQRQISDVMKDRPEAIVNMAHGASGVGAGGTDINTLHTMVTALSPTERNTLGSGVLAKIVNDSGGSPAQMASALNKIAPEARDLLFTPGSQLASDVAALTTVSERVGAVNARQNVGSAATLGERMANMGRTSGPAVAAGTLAHLAGASPSTAAGVAAGVGLPQFAYNRYAKPYLLQHGIPPEVKAAVDAAMRGGVRQVGPAVGSMFEGIRDQ